MMWDDVASRARGLASHLLRPADREALSHAASLPEALSLLRAHGYVFANAAPESLEEAVRRRAADDVALLSRWAGPRSPRLAVLLDDEARRALRALLRGAAASAPAAARVAAAIPTPQVPERALLELARQPDPQSVAALLRVWEHPFADALPGAGDGVKVDLLDWETRLARAWTRRALSAARFDRPLLSYARGVIDVENAFCALGLSARGPDVPPERCFLPGGRAVPRALFLSAARATPDAAARLLAPCFGDTRLAHLLSESSREGLEDAANEALLQTQRAFARRAPTGTAQVVSLFLRRRLEAADVRRVLWRLLWTKGVAA